MSLEPGLVEPAAPRKGVLRKSLMAPPGYSLVVADSGQIEARVTAWLAGHSDVLDAFRRNDQKTAEYQSAFAAAAGGRALSKNESRQIDKDIAARGVVEGDFYSDIGSTFYGRPLSKKETPDERQVAKCMILGLGFSMGWAKFAKEMLKGMMGAPPKQFTQADADAAGLDLSRFYQDRRKRAKVAEIVSRLPEDQLLEHCAVADGFVTLYRSRNAPIVETWRDFDQVLEEMLEDRSEPAWFGPGDCLGIIRHGIILPNGMILRYPGLEYRTGEEGRGYYSYMGGRAGRERVKVYGGLMTENVVQALARIIVAEQMLWIRLRGKEMGARIVTMTHDEVVAGVAEERASELLGVMLEEMKRPPVWAPDIPLNASGGTGSRYGDCK